MTKILVNYGDYYYIKMGEAMDTMATVPLSEAKAKFSAIANEGKTVFVTKNGKAVLAMVPYQEYQELFRLRQDARFRKKIERARRLQKGDESELLSDDELGAILET